MLETLSAKLREAVSFGGRPVITAKNIEEAVEKIKMALLEADVNLRVARRFVNATAEEALGEKVLRSVRPGEQFVKLVHDKLTAFLGGGNEGLKLKGPDTVSVILMTGLQGSGKTTSSAKLALRLSKAGRRPLLAACDLARPAAAEQLAVLAAEAGVPVCRARGPQDATAVFREALSEAKRQGFDTLIVDTAGRMQADEALMDELAALRDAAKPDETLLVADSMTGQSAADIAKVFDTRIGLTGVILTKFDSDTRGGAALSLKTVTGKPLKFTGTGEKLADLEPFYPERFAGRILGMGDVVGLVEKTQQVIGQKEAQALEHKMRKETITLEDYLSQIRAVKKMGSLKGILDMIPGLSGAISDEDVEKAELGVHEAIICSMTRKERLNHLIIGPSRRTRIARGSGTSVSEVSRLLKRFDKMKSLLKKAAKGGKTGLPPGLGTPAGFGR